VSVHNFMRACGADGQLQPTNVAAIAQTRGVLKNPSQEAGFRSQFLLRHDEGADRQRVSVPRCLQVTMPTVRVNVVATLSLPG
jgi:hypothetical protein